MFSSFTPIGSALVTERLVLRKWTAAELSAVVAGHREDGWAADFPAEGDRVIAGVIAELGNESDDYGHRLIVERDGGALVGSISLLESPDEGLVEIGYGVVASRRGRGYAAEAARALVEFALASAGIDGVYAEVERVNPASIRVLEKAGFRMYGSTESTVRYGT
ncbi:GNAT family N-acetyltransferase [Spirillospora sp. CA-294931]|uniref:GNAT family N-acetyltransferase n=1 Tax=Spirillospora sp. CA-294931 TaxID=3240042 RepID=UPI003D8E9A96